jgi:hypothetical protein
MHISDGFTLFSRRDLYCAFPSVAYTRDGKIILTFRVCHDDRALLNVGGSVPKLRHLHPRSQIMVGKISAPGYKLAHPQIFPIDLAAADQDPNLYCLADGRVFLSSFSWQPIAPSCEDAVLATGMGTGREPSTMSAARAWGTFASVSGDEGRTWSERCYFTPLPTVYTGGAAMRRGSFHRGSVVESDGGDVLIACYDRIDVQNSLFSVYLYAGLPEGPFTFRSRIACASNRIGYTETALRRLDDGRIVAYMRTAGADNRIALSWSADEGQTWSEVSLTPAAGSPFATVDLGSDRLLIAANRKRKSILSWKTDADGSPVVESETVIRAGALEMDFGYPSACSLPDGSALLVYYWPELDGQRCIQGNVLTP